MLRIDRDLAYPKLNLLEREKRERDRRHREREREGIQGKGDTKVQSKNKKTTFKFAPKVEARPMLNLYELRTQYPWPPGVMAPWCFD